MCLYRYKLWYIISKKNMSLFSYFKKNLNKTSNFLSSSISSTFQNKKVDAETLEELESILISADISIEVVSKLIDSIRKVNMSDNNISKIVFTVAVSAFF